MAFEKDPNELGLIYIKPGQPGTKYAETKFFGGRVFDIPEGVPVVFIPDSFIAKAGRPNAGEKVEFFRVMLAPPEDQQQ